MSDTEEEWKPNGRPQSTMARSLAATLDNLFMLDSEVESLTTSVHYKQQMVTIQNRELEALQARIREAEMRLKEKTSRSISLEEDCNTEIAAPLPPGKDVDERNGHSPSSSSSSPESHQSDEGSTDSSTTAATSSDVDDGASHDGSGNERQEKENSGGRNS
ncbi:hypothetical protein ACO22_01791 [Paracoccidioides brasiliensis]|uniref:Uncharacterized protein n=1 Tax=Paracoccidioides brasiliensis TaxID=121759 RepID=A0A1D2JKT5_PARBR|nr:hypothetical protein ACO22_01791 [Paracoccidioides brasiliensis]